MTSQQKQAAISESKARYDAAAARWSEAVRRCGEAYDELGDASSLWARSLRAKVDDEPTLTVEDLVQGDVAGLCVNCWRPRHAHVLDLCPRLQTHVSIDAISVERAMSQGHPRLLWMVIAGAKRTALVDVEVEHLRVGGIDLRSTPRKVEVK